MSFVRINSDIVRCSETCPDCNKVCIRPRHERGAHCHSSLSPDSPAPHVWENGKMVEKYFKHRG